MLTTIDQHVSVDNQVVAVQEYGETNTSLIAGLEAREPRCCQCRSIAGICRKIPDPWKRTCDVLAAGELDVVMFTSAIQVTHLLKVARQLDLEQPVRQSLQTSVVASIGPTTSEMLRKSRDAR